MGVDVVNTTGFPLRDVVMKVSVTGGAKIESWNDLFGGEMWFEEMEPLTRKNFTVRLHAYSSGPVHIEAQISAELVPFATAVAHRDAFVEYFYTGVLVGDTIKRRS